jgi:hypothetical protein
MVVHEPSEIQLTNTNCSTEGKMECYVIMSNHIGHYVPWQK